MLNRGSGMDWQTLFSARMRNCARDDRIQGFLVPVWDLFLKIMVALSGRQEGGHRAKTCSWGWTRVRNAHKIHNEDQTKQAVKSPSFDNARLPRGCYYGYYYVRHWVKPGNRLTSGTYWVTEWHDCDKSVFLKWQTLGRRVRALVATGRLRLWRHRIYFVLWLATNSSQSCHHI